MTEEGDLNSRLWAASRAGDEAMVEELIQAGADVQSKNPSGDNGLHLSSLGGHDNIVKMFLDRGVGVNTRGALKRTPLMWATEQGHYTTSMRHTPLLNGPTYNFREPRSGILHIVRDP